MISTCHKQIMHVITIHVLFTKYDKLNIIRQYFTKNVYFLYIYNFDYEYNYEFNNVIPVLWKQYR